MNVVTPISNHRLPIELGRYNEIVRKDRLCTLCQSNDIGDEYHYLFICPFVKSSRDKYIPKTCIRNPSVLKFCEKLKDHIRTLYTCMCFIQNISRSMHRF